MEHDEESYSQLQQRLLNATEEERESFYMALNAKYEITDVLPPPNHEDLHVLIMAVGYMLLFLLGTCGNVAVLTTIFHVVRSRRATLDNTLIYVIVLSCVDFGVCLSLPFTVIDQILGFWMFGSTVCKLHAVLENFGKILSALILAAMSFDRYAGVCHPQRKWLRSTSVAICILIGLALYALVTLCPLLWSFTARELVLFEKETAPHRITRMRIEKCTMVNISSTVFTMFTAFLFVLCYVVPLCLVAFFYYMLLHRLRQHARQFTATSIPTRSISLYTLAVACFYFMCWTPFWVATAFAVYLEYAGEQGGAVPPVFVYCMYFIHALPFTNSAVNWILYGALNSQLQRRYHVGRPSESITLVGNGFSSCQTPKTAFSALNGISSHRVPHQFDQFKYSMSAEQSIHPIFANGHNVIDRMLHVGTDEVLDAQTQTEPCSGQSDKTLETDDANDNSQSSDDESNAELVFSTSEDATFL
ncbi:ORL1-like opioid receptor [Aphelenchoides avenae]|nr:ORL1-like opioid receptor [Aphelenchus avenae]